MAYLGFWFRVMGLIDATHRTESLFIYPRSLPIIYIYTQIYKISTWKGSGRAKSQAAISSIASKGRCAAGWR